MRGDAEITGAWRDGFTLTITVGWALVMFRPVPPLFVPENAVVVHVVTPSDVNVTAANVKLTYSPVFKAALPPVAVRLMEPEDSE